MKKTQEEMLAENNKMLDAVDGLLRQHGQTAIQVSDGEFFFFTENALEKMLVRARASDRKTVSIFIPLRRA